MPLLEFQKAALQQLLAINQKHLVSFSGSATGSGKTYIAAQMVHDLGLRPLILCPKSVRTNWDKVCRLFGVEPLGVYNPEKIKTGKTPWLTKHAKNKWQWNIPDRDKTIILVDEAHQYGATNSQNATMLAYMKSSNLRVHMMSATLAESPLRLRSAGYLMNMHSFSDFYQWALRHGCYRNPWNQLEFSKGPRGQEALKAIHAHIYPEYGVRLRISDIPDFPESTVQPEAYDLDTRDEAQEAYDEADREIHEQHVNPLVALLRARQKTELLKCELVHEMAQEQIEEGKSVVVFCNFKDSLRDLKQRFNGSGISVSEIHGDQSGKERDAAIEDFQENRNFVCLAIVQAGGVGISLHDLKGRPRISYIFPPLTARDLLQALGRIHRAGALSAAVQKIPFIAGTIEETVCGMVRKKISCLELLNDGELTGGII